MPGGPVKRNGHYTPNGVPRSKGGAPNNGGTVPHPGKPTPVPSVTSTATGGTDVHTPEGTLTLNVRGLQQHLRKDGYDIKVDGKLGPQTLSALRNYYKPNAQLSPALAHVLGHGAITGERDPGAWNKQFGTTKTRLTPYRTPNDKPGGSLDKNGNTITTQYAPPGQDVDLSGVQGAATTAAVDPISAKLAQYGHMIDPNAASKFGKMIDPKAASQFGQQLDPEQAAKFGTMIDPKLAQFGKMIDPSTADAIAGQQYDPQIREAQLALANDPGQAATNQGDIGHWYQQVLDSQKTAAGRDTAASKAGVSSIGDAGAALVASLGGSANMGAGNVAAASQNATGTLAALGAAQDQYNNDIAPLLADEKAGMLTNQRNKDSKTTEADRVALENLQGQRGQALTTAQAQIRQENNGLAQSRAGMGLDIGNANNTLSESRQGARQSAIGANNALSEARVGARTQVLGENNALSEARMGAHTNAIDANNSLAQSRAGMGLNIRQQNAAASQQGFQNSLALAQAQIAAMMSGLKVQGMQSKLNAPPKGSFAGASPSQKQAAYNEALSSLLDPTTHQPLKLTPQQAQAKIAGVLGGFGWQMTPGSGVPAFAHNIVGTYNTLLPQ